MLPVVAKVFEDDASGEQRGLASELMTRNSDFCRFVDRMKGMGRFFVVKSKKDKTTKLVSPSLDDSSGRADANEEWLDCCLREYLERKRLFEKRYTSRTQLLMRIVGVFIPFLAVLWVIWPMWRVLIDVETDTYYKALGVSATAAPAEITKAYRGMMKKWHPDQNPNCGQYCRDQTERIKEAYDMLLARGDHRFTLANQYHESLMTIRSGLSFRGYQISGDAAMEAFMILSRLLPGSAGRSSVLRWGCSAAILLFCTIHETLYVSGFSLAAVIGLFYYGISMAKASAQQRSIEEVWKDSYFDLLSDAAALLGCAAFTSVALLLKEQTTVSLEEVFRIAYGCVYVLSFLYKFSPNIYDNFLMRKYSLPITYVDMGTETFTWTRFAWSELSFLVDDLFVFTCRIPSPFRVVVYMTHFLCICQLFMLPWDGPMSKAKSAAKARAHQAPDLKASAAPESGAPQASSGESHEAVGTDETHIVESFVSKEDQELFADLDTELVTWLDIASLKYKGLIGNLGRRFMRQNGPNVTAVDFAPSANLQNVCVVAFTRAAGAAAEGPPPKLDVLCQVHDPEVSRLIAQERGPRMLMPARPNAPWTLDMARAEYNKLLGAAASLTGSQIWRRRTPTSVVRAARLLWAVTIAVLAVAIVCLLVGPSALSVVRSTKGIDNSLRPQLYARFATVLPAKHFTNSLAGGLLTVANSTLCVLDWWDAGATLGFIR